MAHQYGLPKTETASTRCLGFLFSLLTRKCITRIIQLEGGDNMPTYTREMLNDREPVYLQIIKRIKSDIVAKRLKSGDSLPSRRELAVALEINPNTVQKAYKLLEDEGILVTGNNAKSIISVDEVRLGEIKRELARESLELFYTSMREMNITKKEAVSLLDSVWRDDE